MHFVMEFIPLDQTKVPSNWKTNTDKVGIKILFRSKSTTTN